MSCHRLKADIIKLFDVDDLVYNRTAEGSFDCKRTWEFPIRFADLPKSFTVSMTGRIVEEVFPHKKYYETSNIIVKEKNGFLVVKSKRKPYGKYCRIYY